MHYYIQKLIDTCKKNENSKGVGLENSKLPLESAGAKHATFPNYNLEFPSKTAPFPSGSFFLGFYDPA